MSAQLPAIRVGHHNCRLPLCEASAAALLAALLDPAEESARAELILALLLDPALALWATLHRSRHIALDAAQHTIASLADWLAGHLPLVMRDHVIPEVAVAGSHQSPAVPAATVAEVVAVAASEVGKSQPAFDERYLASLLGRAIADVLSVIDCSADLASLITNQCGLAGDAVAGSAVIPAANKRVSQHQQKKSQATKTRRQPSRARTKRYPTGSLPAQALERWLAPPGFAARYFATLAGTLAELADLKARFDDRLEEEKLASLAEFAAGAGHEINNPLAVISGRAQLFLRTEEDPERRRELAIINTQARRVHEMIADLMLFARPPEPQLATCDVAVIIDELVAELADRAAEQGVQLAVHVPSGVSPVEADATQVLVAMRAVCENALEALESGGRIEIALRSDDAMSPSPLAGEGRVRGFVAITIRDNGPGMPPEVRRHAFDPFFSGRGAGRGLGNGLAKCWRIITGHGGSVEIDSTPAGTSVTMLLPTARQPAPRPQHEKTSDA